jgi:MFS family permease
LQQASQSVSSTRNKSTSKTVVLLTTSLSLFFSTLTFAGINVALPAINRDFKADAILLSWVVTSFLLASSVFQLPWGRIADIVGIKRMFLYGMIVVALASGMAAYASSIAMLIAAQVMRGIGCSMIVSNATALLTAVYPVKERGRALGINAAVLYMGLSMGPFLGGVLTEHAGWRSMFLLNILTYTFLIVLILWKVKGEWSLSKGEKLDFPGMAVYGVALVVLMYGFSLLPDLTGAVLTLAGIGGMAIFIKWESRARFPILDINIFRENRTLLFGSLASLVSFCATFAVTFLLSLYLQYIKGLSAESAGALLLATPILQALISPFSGKLSDRSDPRLIASAGLALTLLGLAVLVFLTDGSPLILPVVAMLAIGAGCALFSTPNVNSVMSSVTPRYFGVAAATLGTARSVGMVVSMGITMIVMASVIGRVVITSEYYPAFVTSARIAFGIFSLLCVGGIFASLARGKGESQAA